ncbi:MAG: hypothetical protein ABIK78_04975 [candidate division WOR-3 bacterium]
MNKTKKSHFLKMFVLGLIILIYSLPLFADAPYEKYHIEYKDISKDVLKNTIGILTINSGIKKGTKLKGYFKKGKKFIYEKTLKVKKTIPISNFGFHPPIDELYIENYRYPIVDKFEQFLCIVYDPIRNLKIWVNIKEIEKNFYTDILMVDSIPIPNNFFINIFYFTENGKRKVYKEPKNDADFIIISKDEYKYSLFKIIGQKDEFIKIGIFHFNYDTNEEWIEPLGWIKIRDKYGRLMFWIKYVDLC